jgi:DNA-binding GntR family transcriptional regulator
MSLSELNLRDALEDRILTDEIRPGERLDEAALALEFNVSRTPIRQAIFELAATGLVERFPRRGAFVAQIGPERLSEMFQVMAELEALCARNATRRATPSDLAHISDMHAACDIAAKSGDSDAYYYANEKFHDAIRIVGANTFLRDEIDRLQKRLQAFRRIQLRARDRVSSSLEEHYKIVVAIKAGDETQAANAMRAHVSVQGDQFADLLATLSQTRHSNWPKS